MIGTCALKQSLGACPCFLPLMWMTLHAGVPKVFRNEIICNLTLPI